MLSDLTNYYLVKIYFYVYGSLVIASVVDSDLSSLVCCDACLQSINPVFAKKMQEDRGRDYMNARRVAKEYEATTKGLNKNAASVPPQNTADEIKQVFVGCYLAPAFLL